MSSKVISCEIQEDGYISSHRPAPSAGARHPIDLIISLPNNFENDLYYYNAFDHTLNKLEVEKILVSSFMNHINDIISIDDGTIIWFVAHPERTESKYENAQSLIWRDAGALIYCLQLTCTAFKINSCPIGSLGEPFISKMFEERGQVIGVGGLLLG
jgi:SagB-type dehydrogenase family enzyme